MKVPYFTTKPLDKVNKIVELSQEIMKQVPVEILTCKRTVQLHEVEKDRGPATLCHRLRHDRPGRWRGSIGLEGRPPRHPVPVRSPSIARFIIRVDRRRNRQRAIERRRAGTGPEIRPASHVARKGQS